MCCSASSPRVLHTGTTSSTPTTNASPERPLAFGQVYAALARLEKEGLAEVVEKGREGARTA